PWLLSGGGLLLALLGWLALHRGEQEMRLISFAVMDFSDATFLLRPDSRFLYVNDTTCRVLGYSHAEMRRMGVPDVDPNYPLENWNALWQEMKRLGFLTIKTVLRTRDGRIIPVEIRLKYIDYHGREFGFAWARDISERLRTEDALKEARDAALEATRLKSQFLANMSHEIRTPMNGMLGMARLLLQTTLTPRQREFTRNIIESGEHLVDVIGDILDFSKIEAGKLEFSSVDFDAVDVVENVCGLFLGEAREKGVELAFQAPARLPLVCGDAMRLRQVLGNLVSNAVKFTQRGHVDVLLDVVLDSAAETVLRFSVRDTGIGIDPQQRAAIFEPFTQADTSVTRKFGGTGLGLTISRQLLEMLESRLELSSTPGAGSEFSFNLRLPKAARQPPAPAALAGAGRALLLEGNPVVAENLARLLQAAGFEVVRARDAGTAQAQLQQAPAACCDLLFIDQREWSPQLLAGLGLDDRQGRVVMLVADDTAEVGTSGARRIAGFLRKPVTRVQLGMLLQDLGQLPDDPPRAGDEDGLAPAARLGVRVLVVEDNKMNRKLFGYLLDGLGCDVEIAGSGHEALVQVNNRRYDAVLMDCHLPDMDGFAVAAAIRRLEGDAERTPIIAVTADAMSGTRERCLASGMDDFLLKPIAADDLRAQLVKWVPRAAGPLALEDALAAAPGDPAPGFDARVLERLRQTPGARGSLLQEFVQAFLDEAPHDLGRLHLCLDAGNFRQLREVAHHFKGSCGVLGAQALSALCQRLQEAAELADGAQARAQLEALEREYTEASAVLVRLAASG
ncbi:MAG TPA: response regulator, partial [Gammaproteobacteria bacterium]